MTVEQEAGDPSLRELADCRTKIEQIDSAMVELLAQRVELGKRIGQLKRVSGIPMLDPAREAEVVRQAATLALKAGLDEEPVRQVFWQVIGLSRKAQGSED